MTDITESFTVTYRCLKSELKSIYPYYLGKFIVDEFILADGRNEYRYVGFIVPREKGNYILIPQLLRKDPLDLVKIQAIEEQFKLEVNPSDES